MFTAAVCMVTGTNNQLPTSAVETGFRFYRDPQVIGIESWQSTLVNIFNGSSMTRILGQVCLIRTIQDILKDAMNQILVSTGSDKRSCRHPAHC